MRCLACGNDTWRVLPVPNQNQSITTSGVIMREPLEREQCMNCGLLQRRGGNFLGHGRFYEEQYAKYYERPGGQKYDGARYTAMANWMKAALGDEYTPSNVLDIGCGAGWQMKACQNVYRDASIEGLEPSAVNAERAREAGFTIHSERFGGGTNLNKKYDLIYANNVLQHVVDPVAFLVDIANHLTPEGRVAMILPDATEASCEMLWLDHNFSFRPRDLSQLSKHAGLYPYLWQDNPKDNNLLDKQLVVLSKQKSADAKNASNSNLYPTEELFERRTAYLMKWQALDGELLRRTAPYNRVFHFGASMWTWLLAGYCPQYWAKVISCVVDNEHGRCLDKTVLPTSELTFGKEDCLVLGVNPANQATFNERFQTQEMHVIQWSDRISS
jgi:2-polyprenyl-3-methyl-5-hydroxy-6-metoxy-1,4-benzoquinol methylase